MEKRVLVLTNYFFPIQILRWQDAVRLICLDAVTVVAEYDEEIRSPSVTWKTPAVVRLRRSVTPKKRGIKFSRFNVYTRDKFCCQYCGDRRKQRELTYDHVVPRASGGRTTWENIVTACRPCNNHKGRRTCDDVGMWPLKTPVRPKSLPHVSPIADLECAPEEWHDYLRPYLPAQA